MSSNDHIDLNRLFWPASEKEDYDPDFNRYLWSRESQPGWPELLQMPRVIVLAEAGTGKSEEFRETARRLRDEGNAAFFCAIEELAGTGIEEAFDVGTYSEFTAWRDTDQLGWFFLDSVDEARLASYDYFKQALKRISRALGGTAHRAFVYISGRGSDWNAISDLSLVEEWLPIPSTQSSLQTNETGCGPTPESPENDKSTDNDRKIRVFRLAPLTQEQIQKFARHRGVREPDRFTEAIERADAGIFAERPRDLIDLIAYWQQFGKIASLAEMTEYNVNKKLTETNPKHGKKDRLSPDKARAGAEIIAAALTLSRCNFIALPDPKAPTIPSGHTLDAKALLADWAANEVESLLRRALFDEATYGRAKIHHRSVREYLTAQWIHNLLQQGNSRRSVEQLLFAERYGLDVVIPSMKPVAAWLALRDENTCEKLCEIAPEILIGYGDPSQLPIPVREKLLRKFAEVCASNRYYDESLDLSAIRRLANSQLTDTIIQLLEEYRSSEDVRQLLLRTIWQGEIKECAEIALTFALDSTMGRYTRLGGIRAVGTCGTKDQQQRLVTAILAETETGDVELTSAVCEQSFPQLLSVDVLLETLQKIPSPKRFSVSSAVYALEKIAEHCPEEKLLPLLEGFVHLLELEPHIDKNFCKISKRYAWLLPHGGNLACRLLMNSSPCIEEAVLRAVELTVQSRDYGNETHSGPKAELQAIIDGIPQFRHIFFWRAVERIREIRIKNNERLDDWWFVRFEPAPGKIIPEDFEYFLDQVESLPERDDQLVAYSVALSLWDDAGRDKARLKRLKLLAHSSVEMATKLDSYLNPPPLLSEELERRREMAEIKLEQEELEQQQNRHRQVWIERLQAAPAMLRTVNEENVQFVFHDLWELAWIIHESADRGLPKWGTSSWETLKDEFGQEVAEAARDGLMAYWRFYRPATKSELDSNNVPNQLIAGSIGLAIEAKTKPNWVRQLSHEEAYLAARYALREMNGFPDWTGELLTIHPEVLDEVLQREIYWEFELIDGERSEPVHHMLAQLLYTELVVLRNRHCPYIFQLLQGKEPWRDQTLENALSIVLQWDELNIDAFAKLAKQRCLDASNENRLLTWLVAWLCTDADGAMIALQQWLSQAKGKIQKKERMIRFCGAMGDHHFKRFGSRYRDFERIEFLREFVPLIYRHIRIEDDNVHEGVFTPDARDHAEGMRSYLLNKVCDTPGPRAFETILEFSKNLPYKRSRERMLVIALRRAAADAEFSPWVPADVAKFAQEGERRPTTARKLFDLVCSRLDDIKYNLEDGDTSIAVTLQREDQEPNLRIWFTKELRDTSRGKYIVAPEEELADATRPDIRVHVPEIDASCVIELKISDNWSFQKHIERLHNQLVGQYLRDSRSRFGVFLLVRRYKRHWRSSRRLTFEELVTHVQNEADQIIQSQPNLEGIRVLGIDLMKRRSNT